MGLILTVATSAGCKADIGDPCTSADDCEPGLVCAASAEAGPTVCQLPPGTADMKATAQSDLGPADGGL